MTLDARFPVLTLEAGVNGQPENPNYRKGTMARNTLPPRRSPHVYMSSYRALRAAHATPDVNLLPVDVRIYLACVEPALPVGPDRDGLSYEIDRTLDAWFR